MDDMRVVITLRLLHQALRAAFPLILLAGCSTLGVKVDSRPDITQRRQASRMLETATPSPAADLLRRAQSLSLHPDARLALLLDAAHAALPQALKGENEERKIYASAVGQAVSLMRQEHFFRHAAPRSVGAWKLVLRVGKGFLDPAQAGYLVPASSVRITGLHRRTLQSGIGVPYVFGYPRDSPFLAGQPGISRGGISTPATAVLTFEGSTAVLGFLDTLRHGDIRVQSRRVPVAADFSAPIALLVSRNRNRSLDIRSFLLTRQRLGLVGLYQYQPYDPNKIPVVFVHGLLSRPEAWTQALNGLMADPYIRSRYQFWFFLYPTGLPIWKSAALFRAELDRFHRELEKNRRNPNLHRMILVGHSMGGIICSLVVREGGERLWGQFSDAQIDQLSLSPEARRFMGDLIFFKSRRDISEVIFVATPHRGSRLAVNPVARFFSRLIMLPEFMDPSDRMSLVGALRADIKDLFAVPANSVRFLQANSPLLKSIQALPLARSIPYHSIIGDRGRGDSPMSSDGVVPYWSSHLESAASETIVPSGHGANEAPEAIGEMRRILRAADAP